jgi:two-component system response regulator NreC
MPTRPRILMLTAVSEPAFVVDALGAGALGYALKADGADELVSAIEKTSRGQKYVAPALRDLLDARPTSLRDEASGVISTLSSREREVFDLVVAGYTNERMSQELFISVKTVETHRSRINKKLRVHSTVELIRFAALHGLFATQ